MHLLTTAAWYSTWSSIVGGLHSHTNAARRPQFTMQAALQHHLIICTEDVHEDCLLRSFFEFLRPFVRGTPTTHSEGLLLPVGALPCAPTYNRGVVQHVVFNRWGLAQPHECSSKAAIYHASSSATSSNNLYRGRNCCMTHASKATYRYFFGTRLRLPRRVTLERVPTDWYFSILCLRRRYAATATVTSGRN